jgi:hypothetical protein
MQMSFFLACFVYTERRIDAERYDLLCCGHRASAASRKIAATDSAVPVAVAATVVVLAEAPQKTMPSEQGAVNTRVRTAHLTLQHLAECCVIGGDRDFAMHSMWPLMCAEYSQWYGRCSCCCSSA